MRSTRQHLTDTAGFWLSNVVQVAITVRCWGRTPLWQALVAALAGFVLADLFTALLHWAFDTWGDAGPTFWGSIVKPFREHHERPDDIISHGYLETVGNSCWALLPLLVVALFAPPQLAQLLSWTAYFSVQANVVHRAAHRSDFWFPKNQRLYRFLSEIGLAQRPADHKQHHVPPHKQNWAILSGWWNPLLNVVLPRIERGLTSGRRRA